MTTYLIGLDDTDAGESIGTGAMARELQILLARKLNMAPLGITRHQLLVHPDIPYTSHNSAACLMCRGDAAQADVQALCEELIAYLQHDGADPGLCIATDDLDAPEIVAFGMRATREVVQKAEAIALAANAGLVLRELGGTGLGVIGALSAVGLRLGRMDGRYLSLPGLHSMRGQMSVAELLAGSQIDRVVDDNDDPLSDDDRVDTSNWVRPELVDGEIVLRVRRRQTGGFFIRKHHEDG